MYAEEDVEEIMKAQNGTLSNSRSLSLSLTLTKEHRKILCREEEEESVTLGKMFKI
jgi:hypothetical protein